jgi:hypothetical protein
MLCFKGWSGGVLDRPVKPAMTPILMRGIPLTDEIMDVAFVAYGQNGEPLRSAHGFPIRLLMPGFEGNLNIKWLRRLKFGSEPWMTRWETDRYTQLRPDGKAWQFQLRMETNSVITSPSGMMEIRPGYNRISGLAWSGHGKIAKVEVSIDASKKWKEAQVNGPVLARAQVRFQMDWECVAANPKSTTPIDVVSSQPVAVDCGFRLAPAPKSRAKNLISSQFDFSAGPLAR